MSRTSPPRRARSLLLTHAWLVLMATFVAVGAAALVATTRPLAYTATAEVVVSPQQTGSTSLRPDMGTESAIARSGVVVERAAETLDTDPGHAASGVSVSVVLESLVLRISYHAATPEEALRGASAFANAYVAYRNAETETPATTLVTAPSLPASGSRGSLALFLALGLFAGVAVGASAAWLWDRVSDRLRNAEELQRLSGLPILVRVPRWSSKQDPLSRDEPAREAFAYVAARLSAMVGHGSGKTVVVTSPRGGAGTTTVACGTAAQLAAQGKTVVLIAASPGGLRPEQALGVITSPGLSHLLARGCSPHMALHPTRFPRLSVVPLGEVPGGRLALEDLHLVLERLEKTAYVVIDAPALLDSADSLLLADVADVLVLVGDLRRGTRTDARDALALLDDVTPRAAGWVVNRPPRHRWRRADAMDTPALVEPSQEVTAAVADTGPVSVVPAVTRSAGWTRKDRPRPGMHPPVAPRTGHPARDDDQPDRATAAAARRP